MQRTNPNSFSAPLAQFFAPSSELRHVPRGRGWRPLDGVRGERGGDRSEADPDRHHRQVGPAGRGMVSSFIKTVYYTIFPENKIAFTCYAHLSGKAIKMFD